MKATMSIDLPSSSAHISVDKMTINRVDHRMHIHKEGSYHLHCCLIRSGLLGGFNELYIYIYIYIYKKIIPIKYTGQ